MTARVIDVFNQKGGVGKTTVVTHLAASLGGAGQRVLVVDFDKQANATDRLLGYGVDYELSAYHLLADRDNKVSVHDVALPARAPFKNVWVVPGGLDLLNICTTALNVATRPGAWFALEKKLEKIIEDFDFILIDNPPDISPLTSNGLCAAARWGGYLVPMDMHPDSSKGYEDIQLAIEELKSGKVLTDEPPFLGVVIPVLLKKNSSGTKRSVTRLNETFSGLLAPIEIPHSSRFTDAAEDGKLLCEVDPKGATWKAYMQFAQLLTGVEIGRKIARAKAKGKKPSPSKVVHKGAQAAKKTKSVSVSASAKHASAKRASPTVKPKKKEARA